MAETLKKIKDFVRKSNLLVSRTEEYQNKYDEILKTGKELLWRDIFVDTVKGYTWYHEKSLSLGRWAIGYNYAYILVRVLHELRPNSILECGLGQSSKIIADYVDSNNRAEYDIVEQDREWLDFFKRNCQLNDRTKVHIRNIIEAEFSRGEGAKTNIYEDFASVVEGKKYALISIDGPWGSDIYSRVDVIEHIPSILQEDFVILVDDFERAGEKNMVRLLKDKLDENGIHYAEAKYSGLKDMCVIASEKWRFLTTL